MATRRQREALERIVGKVTTAIVSTPEPVQELGPDEEDDVIRWLLAEMLLSQLLLQPVDPLTDCRFQLYLYDPDRKLLMPILEPGHPGPSPGFAPHQGTVGQAWATNDYVVATGPAVSDGTFGLTADSRRGTATPPWPRRFRSQTRLGESSEWYPVHPAMNAARSVRPRVSTYRSSSPRQQP